MPRSLRNIIPALTVAALAVAVNAKAADLKVGDKAPDFTLKGSDGKEYSLSQFKGKKAVILAWFPKASTRGCTIECKSFKENGALLKDKDVALFTISVDKPEDNKTFADNLSLDYPILSDPEKTTANAYGVLRAPGGVANRWTYYIDKEGVVRAIDKQIKVESAAADAAKKVDELGITK